MAALTLLLGLFASWISLAVGQNPNSPCYDPVTGGALKCEPIFQNIAYGLPSEATHTCGERVINDANGIPYPPRQVDRFHTYYSQTGATGQRKYRDYCDITAADPNKRHGPQNMVDLDGPDNATWWQSITLYEYKERNLGDMVQAVITLNLGKAYDITYIKLKFHSSRPESFSIFKKTSETSDWQPYHYYSASCLATYGLPQNGIIDTETRAVCTGQYSDISPLSGGDVAFGTLENRYGSYDFHSNKAIQEFVTATSLQIRLDRLNTFGDEVFEDTSVLQSYYYAIRDLAVGGKCKCNGHANECVPSSTIDGQQSMVCMCQHNTTGADCGQCLRSHNDRPWSAANDDEVNPCVECDCSGRSDLCYFNQTLFNLTGSGGYCQDCRDFTAGANCEHCKPNYFRRDTRDVCSSCNCDETGSANQQCDSFGQCVCKPGVTGLKCDRCEANYYDFGTYGCRPCGCVAAGSFENRPYCDSRNGQCTCKENVEGQNCGTCKPGYFNLDEDNKFGCIACFCNGKTSQCTSAQGYAQAFINSVFRSGDERWTAVDRQSEPSVTSYNSITEDLALSADRSTGELYFSAPERFLGDQKYSYNQFLTFTLRIGESQGRPSQRDVILEGNGRSIYLPIFAQNNSVPGIREQTYSFRLHENPLYRWTPTLSALEFQRLLSDLTAIKIRGTYNTEGTGYLDEVRLETAHNGQQIGDISSIEQCVCPDQYVGQFCESCAPGFRRETPFGGRNSECVPCECNGHSETCDAESGACICTHETTGHNCEKCKEGWYGTATDGTPEDCTACPCPGQGPCVEQLDGTVSCLDCPEGYGGDLCDMCVDNFYGDVMSGDNCTNCNCSGNVDSNAVGNCNTTSGICLKCIFNTGGDHCENCLSGFYGDATSEIKGDCKPCECNTYGTNKTLIDVCEESTGQCACLPYVTGRQCDQCEEGYYNLESTRGCEACLCDPEGSNKFSCDLQTGQCDCKPGIGGLRCNECVDDHFGFSSDGCQDCECLLIGSAHGQCDDSGQCVCKDDTRITGLQCDTCRENKHNLTAGCLDCPDCYNLVQDAVDDIRQGLINLGETLKNINDNPNVADDEEFTNQLAALQDEIAALHDNATDLKNSGGPISDDLKAIDEDLMKLQEEADRITQIVNESTERYENIDLNSLNDRIDNVTDEVAKALEDFNKNSSALYSNILSALGKNGVVSESQNMTAMAQQSTKIAANQTLASDDIIMTSNDAVDIADQAYNLALNVTKAPADLADKLAELEKRIGEGNDLLAAVNKTAQEALDKASEIYSDALDSLNNADRVVVPDVDASLYLQESQSILDEALLQKNKTTELREKYEGVLNDTAEWLKRANTSYNQTYTEQQITDALMAEVDVALQKAMQAIQDSNTFLEAARKQLETLQDFDRTVKENKEKALAALERIPEIERLLEEADNETIRASEAVEGAKNAANESKNIALEAQNTANEASKNAAEILAEAKETKVAADTQSNTTDQHGLNLDKIKERLDILEPKGEADGELIALVLNEAERARQLANESASILEEAKAQVDEIIKSIENLPELNTTELERLEAEMDRLEAEFNAANINKQVQELQIFSDQQRNLANLHVNSLTQLKADVANIEMIVNTVPDDPYCFTKPTLEINPEAKLRRRQRKAKKRLMRH